MNIYNIKTRYLPAGRVDYGESFPTGAIRETQEEAGIPVTLSGVLRIQVLLNGILRKLSTPSIQHVTICTDSV